MGFTQDSDFCPTSSTKRAVAATLSTTELVSKESVSQCTRRSKTGLQNNSLNCSTRLMAIKNKAGSQGQLMTLE